MDLFKILYPIEWVVAWLMYLAHSACTWVGLDPASGLAWGLSIVVLVIIMRIILIPLFFKQIRASRGMQMLAPEMQAIQKKYKGKTDTASREAMSRETMALYKKHNTNPFSSCLPILAQSPIFFALFRVLTNLDEIASGARDPLGPINATVAAQAEQSTIFGAPLSSTFMTAATSADPTATRIVTIALIVAMSATTFLTQRQLTMKNMPASALEGPMAQQQKVLLYVLPLVFAFSGVNFPIGVLLYWTTTNLWSMGQQFYTIRRMPTPGSQAERLMRERRARKGKSDPSSPQDLGTASSVLELPEAKGQRTQPVRKDRVRAKPPTGAPSAGSPSSRPRDAAAGTTAAGAPVRKVRPKAAPGARPAGSTAAGARPATGKPAGTKAAGSKIASAKPTDSTSTGATSTGATSTSAKASRPAPVQDGSGDDAPPAAPLRPKK